MTEKTIAILNKIEEEDYRNRMKIEFTDGEMQITATILTTAPLAVMLHGDLGDWIEAEKALWDEPEEYFQKQLRYATEERTEYADLFSLLKGVKLDYSSSDIAIFELEDSVKLIIKR